MSDPVMLVTGTSGGIGRYLVEYYVQKGFRVIGCSRKEGEAVENYQHYIVDVRDEVAVNRLFAAIRKEYNRLDVLINNAGIASMNHVLLTPASTVRNILDTNVVGAFLFSREAARLMQKNKWGRIVNIGSLGVPMRIEGEAAYLASKGAIVTLSQIMARELAEFGITVNVVGPTVIDTDMTHNVPRKKLQHLIDQLAIKRFGTFADISNVIDFFIQPTSDYITGQTIYLGGA